MMVEEGKPYVAEKRYIRSELGTLLGVSCTVARKTRLGDRSVAIAYWLPDREAFGEVVEPDAQGDEEREAVRLAELVDEAVAA